jgi:hypothetical protein
MKSWKTRLSVVLAMLAMVLVASVPAVADSVDVECDADDGGVCEENVSVSSYEDDLLEEEAVEDLFIEGVDGECSLFDPFCELEWWPW